MEALFWKDVGMVMISLQPWASDWYWICTVKTQKKGFQASITSNNWIQCWSILLNFSSCLPLHLHHPEDFFVLIYNFQFSVIWENRAGGKQGRNWWRGMPENRLVEKERTEKTRRQKIQETEGILILDYVAKRSSIRLQMRCLWTNCLWTNKKPKRTALGVLSRDYGIKASKKWDEKQNLRSRWQWAGWVNWI